MEYRVGGQDIYSTGFSQLLGIILTNPILTYGGDGLMKSFLNLLPFTAQYLQTTPTTTNKPFSTGVMMWIKYRVTMQIFGSKIRSGHLRSDKLEKFRAPDFEFVNT